MLISWKNIDGLTRSAQARQIRFVRKLMNESTHRKSATVSTVKDSKDGVPHGSLVRRVVCGAAVCESSCPRLWPSSCLGVHVKVLNMRNSTGTVEIRNTQHRIVRGAKLDLHMNAWFLRDPGFLGPG